MIRDPGRRLEECPLVIFIAYTVVPDAEGRGYSEWLRAVDMPFFNAVPGTRHYANWRLTRIEAGTPPVWDYFDFQGLETEDDLDRVWFNPDLDAFRSEWLRLWGYGRDAPPVLRHSYLLRPAAPPSGRARADALTLSAGRGTDPDPTVRDTTWRVEGVLRKHFGADTSGTGGRWLIPATEYNPLELDWLAIRYGADESHPGAATLIARAERIAGPDE